MTSPNTGPSAEQVGYTIQVVAEARGVTATEAADQVAENPWLIPPAEACSPIEQLATPVELDPPGPPCMGARDQRCGDSCACFDTDRRAT